MVLATLAALAGQLVCANTVLSLFTMFFWTFLFKSLGML